MIGILPASCHDHKDYLDSFNSIAYWVIFHTILSSADSFKINFFEKILSGIPSECQTVWTLIRPDDSSGLICIALDDW